MDFLKLASERYSVRKFKKDKLDKDTINKILESAHVAPTGCNYQPFRILVLESDEAMKSLKNCTKYDFDAPLAMVVCWCKDKSWIRSYDGEISAPVDADIVTTHMMLMGYSLGVGSCWVMSFDPQKLKEEYNIPDYCEPRAILVMGYPSDESKPSHLHGKFRPKEDLVFYNKF